MPRYNYTASEYTDMILIYGECHRNSALAIRTYRERYGNTRFCPSNGRIIVQALQRLRENQALLPHLDSPRNPRKPFKTLHKQMAQETHSESLENETCSSYTPDITQIKDESSADQFEFVNISKNEPNAFIKDQKNFENAVMKDKKEAYVSLNSSAVEMEIKLEKIEIEYPELFRYDEENSIFSVNEATTVKTENDDQH